MQICERLVCLLLAFLLLLPVMGCERGGDRIVVGSKNFTEQVILGELFAQVIEARTHLAVERRFYLAGTFICQQAILAGRIDIYPEYTGTALTAVLKQQPSGDKLDVYRRVQQGYEKFGLSVGRPLGFDDSFAMVIRGDDGRQLHLQTLSQAASEQAAGVGAILAIGIGDGPSTMDRALEIANHTAEPEHRHAVARAHAALAQMGLLRRFHDRGHPGLVVRPQ